MACVRTSVMLPAVKYPQGYYAAGPVGMTVLSLLPTNWSSSHP